MSDTDASAAAAPDDGRSFANLTEARDALWRGVSDLDDVLNDLRGSYVGPAADGLWHCSSRALDGLREIKKLHERLHEAAAVVRANDATRLSGEALRARYQPGPHRDPA